MTTATTTPHKSAGHSGDSSIDQPDRGAIDDILLRTSPMLGIILVAIIGGLLDHLIIKAVCSSQCSPVIVDPESRWIVEPAMEYSGAVLIFALLGLSVLVITAVRLRRDSGLTALELAYVPIVIGLAATFAYDFQRYIVVGLLAALAATLAFRWHHRRPLNRRPEDLIASGLALLGVASVALAMSPFLREAVLREQLLKSTVYSGEAGGQPAVELTVIAAAFLGVLVVLGQALYVMIMPRPSRPVPVAHRIERLRSTSALIRGLLIGSSIFLVLGIMQVHVVYEWGFMLVAGAERPENYERIIMAITGISGVFYSVFLISIFTPALVLVRRWARALAAEQVAATRMAEPVGDDTSREAADHGSSAPPPTDVDEWLTANGLETSWPRVTMAILGMVAPFIAGGPAAPILAALIS